MRLLLRLFGVRVIESPEAFRVYVPKWLGDKVLNRTYEELSTQNPDLRWRLVGRNIIGKM